MATKKQKIAAALAAVNLYLEEEQAAANVEAPLKKPDNLAFSPWGQSGRQEMMTMRRLISLKAFSRF